MRVKEDVRRCLTRDFPYAVIYTIEADFLNKRRKRVWRIQRRTDSSTDRRSRLKN